MDSSRVYQPGDFASDYKERELIKENLAKLSTKQLEFLEQQIISEKSERINPNWTISHLTEEELSDLENLVSMEMGRKRRT